jgi:CHAD domain-containing protein
LRLGERLKGAFDLVPSRLTNFERGLHVVGLSTFAESDEAVGVDELAIGLAHRYLDHRFRELLREEPRAWEAWDSEGVHQMRVATRRMRAAFRAFQAVLPSKLIEGFNEEFRWLAGVLGKVRDLDVQKENLRRDTADMPAEDVACLGDFRVYLDEEWHKARRQLLSNLEGDRYRRLIERFGQFVSASPARRGAVAAQAMTVRAAAVEFIDERLKKVLRRGRRLAADSPIDEYHDLRIQCKRLRYLFEFFTPVYGARLTPFVRRLRVLQELLGQLQDTGVAIRQLREYADHVPALTKNRRLLVSLGQLISGHRAIAARSREKFRKVWNRFDRKKLRRRVQQVLSGEPAE